MKGLHLIVIATVLLASWDVTHAKKKEFNEIFEECPAEDPEDPVFLPHESDCTKFYMCNAGKKFEQQCPPYNEQGDRLHFNPVNKTCDWPNHAGCVITTAPPSEDTTLPLEVIEKGKHHKPLLMDKIAAECPVEDPEDPVYFPHESDCTKFYMCRAGEKIEKQCPPYNEQGDRLHFNPVNQTCDWPEHAGCKKTNFHQNEGIALNLQVIEKGKHHKPLLMNEFATECPAENPGGIPIYLPHESDCTKFYMCDWGYKTLHQCPVRNEQYDRLHFNQEKNVCDWPDQAGCENSDSYLNEECPAEDPEGTPTYLPHESDCTKFYMCRKGEKIMQQCPPYNEQGDRLHFNPTLNVCDWPEEAGCENSDSHQNQECPAGNPEGTPTYLPHESDCTKFYVCDAAGRKVLQGCPPYNQQGDKLHFNQGINVCDWPDRAGCQNTIRMKI